MQAHLEEYPPLTGGSRAVALLVSGVFLLAIFGTAVTDAFFPVPAPRPIGAEKDAEDALRRDARIRDGSMARLIERERRLTSRVRRSVLPAYTFLLYAYLSEGTKNVIVGRDDWLFAANRLRMPEGDDEQLGNLGAALFSALERRLATLGVRMVVMPVPRKAVVCREFLAPEVDPRPAVEAALFAGLRTRGVEAVDLREAWATAHAGELYFETDTHWTPTGARLAAEALARAAGLLAPPDQRLGSLEVRIAEAPKRKHDLIAGMGIDFNPEGLGMLDLRDVRETVLTLPAKAETWYAEGEPGTGLALAGTSFSRQQHLAETLAHYVGDLVWDGGQAARSFLGSTRSLLSAQRGAARPHTLFIEVPMHQIYHSLREGRDFLTGQVPALFAENPPGGLREIAVLPGAWQTPDGSASTIAAGASVILARLSPGILYHSGDGVASLQLSGQLSGGSLQLMLQHGDQRLSIKLRAGEIDVVLPLISAGATIAGIRLRATATSAVQLDLDKVALVHECDPSTLIPLAVTAGPAPDTVTDLIPASPSRLGRHAALLLVMGEGMPSRESLQIELLTAESQSPEHVLHLAGISPGTQVAISLAGAAGKLVQAVRVSTNARGAGGPPVTSATLNVGRR